MTHAFRFKSTWIAVSLLLLALIASEPLFAQAAGQLPLAGRTVPKFVDALPTFVGARVDGTKPLTINMVERSGLPGAPAKQQVLPAGFGATTVWGYEINDGTTTYGPLYPTHTIVAKKDLATTVTYGNQLTDPQILFWRAAVDQTLHWADPLGHQDMWQHGGANFPISVPPPAEFTYVGRVPAVVHLHGGEVPSAYDGGPDAWFTPGPFPITGPGFSTTTYTYPNKQLGATLWFHDHALGITRLNVYAGMAGFYFLRDNFDTGIPNDPNTAEIENPSNLPVGAQEIEIVFQDRMFDTNGEFLYPVGGTDPTLHPFWQPEFFGDVIVVNGKSWPFLNVEPRRYRFRLLNGSNSRFYNLALFDKVNGLPGPAIYQIGTDGGLMATPVPIAWPKRLLLAPGERADVIVDFTGIASGTTFTVVNDARSPFPGGAPPDPQTVGQLMQFRVNQALSGTDNSFNPAAPGATLVTLERLNPNAAVKTRQLTLNEVMAAVGPFEAILNNTKWDGTMSPGANAIFTEVPKEGTTEVWQIINTTADAHPIHLHLVQFQLVSRQKYQAGKFLKAYATAFDGTGAAMWFDPMMGMERTFVPGEVIPGYGPPNPYDAVNADGALGGNPAITPYLQGAPAPPNPNEVGWKDTFVMYPGEVTTVVVRFAEQEGGGNFSFNPQSGPGYVWHCHIIEHEDNEMMRPYLVESALGAGDGRPAPGGVTPLPVAGGLANLAMEQSPGGLEIGTVAPVSFGLSQNYPNPFNPTTEIRFSLPEAAHVTLTLYNSLGQEVKTLINAEAPAGFHTAKVDGRGLASGIYYYRIQAGSFSDVKSMILMK